MSHPSPVESVRRGALLGLLGTFVVVGLGTFAASRYSNGLYDQEPLNVVAQYAEPWRTLATALVLSGVAFVLLLAALDTARPQRMRASCAILLAIAGLALCIELGMGVHLNTTTGQLHVATLFFERNHLDLPSSPDGVCARADLANPLVWRFGDQSLYPRLLPLPIDSERLLQPLWDSEQQLLQSSPGACPK